MNPPLTRSALGVATLEQLMKDFALHNKAAKSPAGYTPRVGELVSAQFSEDNQW